MNSKPGKSRQLVRGPYDNSTIFLYCSKNNNEYLCVVCLLDNIDKFANILSRSVWCRIINEAGEAEVSGPGSNGGPDRPVQQKFSITLGHKISRDKKIAVFTSCPQYLSGLRARRDLAAV